MVGSSRTHHLSAYLQSQVGIRALTGGTGTVYSQCLTPVGGALPLARLHHLKLFKEWSQLGIKYWNTKGCEEHFSFKPPYPTTPHHDIYLKEIKIHSGTKILLFVAYVFKIVQSENKTNIFPMNFEKENCSRQLCWDTYAHWIMDHFLSLTSFSPFLCVLCKSTWKPFLNKCQLRFKTSKLGNHYIFIQWTTIVL